ncbi:MAG: ornithine cyclodeaminase, partial [Paracoccaceae bacterium]
FQALAFRAICGIKRIRLYDIDPAASAKAAGNLRAMGMETEVCETGQSAVEGAQIITTCTADKRNATVLSDNMVGAGVHVNAIGGDCPGKTELAAAVLTRASIFVEYPEQTRIEGEIQQLSPDHPVTELWQVITGTATGRRDAREITIFDSVGFAIEDFSALRWLLGRVRAGAPHVMLDILADPDDPRDLFGMLRRAQA